MAGATEARPVERIRLSEIISRHTLEPDLRDIYVEGVSDRSFLSWFLGNVGRADIAIFPIDTIEVSAETVETLGLSAGSNRCRVIALSCLLDSALPRYSVVSCIVDLDFEKYCPCGYKNRFLKFTDWNALELYLLTPQVFTKFLILVAGFTAEKHEGIFESLCTALREIFVIRLANHTLGWGMSWIRLNKYILVQEDKLVFHRDRFIDAYLTSNERHGDREKFNACMIEKEDALQPDVRLSANGYDYYLLLYFLVAKRSGGSGVFASPRSAEKTLLACAEIEALRHEELFAELRNM